uniref:Uncharacterized protein n=1 Tax=Arundo donax TaxID=35708 RepID=A0A0A8ZGE6_ARUDO
MFMLLLFSIELGDFDLSASPT